MKTLRLLLPISLLFVAFGVHGNAQGGGRAFYVSTTGNDANPGTITAPWRTISYAVSAASPVTAGDTIHVRAGTYTEVIEIGKSGTVASPITLKAYDGEDCDFTTPGSVGCVGGVGSTQHVILTTGGVRGMIHSQDHTNWIIDGFECHTIDPVAWTSFGQGGCVGFQTASVSSGVLTIQNMYIYDLTQTGFGNPAGIWVDNFRGTVTIRNNKITDVDPPMNPNNGCGIVFFYDPQSSTYPRTIIVENNEIWDVPCGVKWKHGDDAVPPNLVFEVRYNFIHDGKVTVTPPTAIQSGENSMRAHHNVIRNIGPANTGGSGISSSYGDDTCDNCLIDHNTIYLTDRAFWAGDNSNEPIGNIARNNIFWVHPNSGGPSCPCGVGYFSWLVTLAEMAELNYNLYYNHGTYAANFANAAQYTFADLRAAGRELNGVNADPLFVSTSRVVPADFKLQSASPARNAASEGPGHAIGAYELGTECIGVASTCNASSTQPPTAPTGLRIIS